MTVAFVTNSPAPYRIKQMGLLSDFIGENIDFYYTEPLGDDRKWSVDDALHRYLRQSFYLKGYGWLCLGVNSIVKDSRFLILGGYESPTYLWLAILCLIQRKPYFVLHDGIAPSRLNRASFGIKSWPKKFVVKNACGCWVNGSLSKRLFESLGVNAKNIANQYLVSDLDEGSNESSIAEVVFSFCQGRKVAFYSGRLISRKNVSSLLKAVQKMGDSWRLIIAGHGDSEDELKRDSNDQVLFLGHVEQSDLSFLYKVVDVTVLVSDDEPWGLVIYEAMKNNCPVIVGPDVGCASDLVVDKVNGVVLSGIEVETIQKGLKTSIGLDKDELTKCNSGILSEWNLNSSLKEFGNLLEASNA